MSNQDWRAGLVLGLVLLAIVMVAPFGFAPDWQLVDTYAQWVMAAGAVATTAVSSVALIGIVHTYRQTKRSADIAADANLLNQQMLFASTRPYLEIKNVTLSEYSSIDGDHNWWVQAEILNVSQFRAVDVAIQTEVRKRPLASLGNDRVAEYGRTFAERGSPMGSIIVPAHGDAKLWNLGEGDLPEQGGRVSGWQITVAIRYRSNINPEFYYVAASFDAGGDLSELFADPNGFDEERVRQGFLVPESQAAT